MRNLVRKDKALVGYQTSEAKRLVSNPRKSQSPPDSVAELNLFSSRHTRLRRVEEPRCNTVSDRGVADEQMSQ